MVHDNVGAPGVPYFTPKQEIPAGTALSPHPPKLFQALKIRDATFQNRIWVAPMCMYSASAGHLTDFHLMHLSSFAYHGASLTMIEATAVLPNGRITPQDSGLWADTHIAPMRRVADFVHSQGQKLGIQLAHAGRKGSTLAPWLMERRSGKGAIVATEAVGGWPERVWGASAIRWGEGFAMPREMTGEEIKELIDAFRESTRRAVEAGIDVIEIHAAHGYLLSSFLSPISNRRTDAYGGSFENRIRLIVEIITVVREVMPAGMPLSLRVSATEWMETHAAESWDVPSTIRLAKLLPALGVDVLDVSSGGNNEAQTFTPYNDRQITISAQIRAELHAAGIRDLLIGAVGMITEAEQARSVLENGVKGGEDADRAIEVENEEGEKSKADVVLAGRQFLREPGWVLRVAYELGVEVQWPVQYDSGKFRRKV